MKVVYLLYAWTAYEPDDIVGIFSSLGKATEVKKTCKKEDYGYCHGFTIAEYELDERDE